MPKATLTPCRWRAGLLVLVAIASLALAPDPAGACSCTNRTLEQVAAEAGYVFTGVEIDRHPADVGEGERITFEVDTVYRGPVVGDTHTVYVAAGSCGVGSLAEAGRVAVLTAGNTISMCHGIALAWQVDLHFDGQAIDPLLVEEPPVDAVAIPKPRERNAPVPPLAVTVGGLAVTGAAIVGYLRRRRVMIESRSNY